MDDQELDRLYTAVRDHKAAYEAAVAVIQRQNGAIARVRALCYEPVPHPTHDHLCPDDILKALNA